MQQKFTKSQEAFTLAENTYKASVEKYNKAQEDYNEDMTNSCKVSSTHIHIYCNCIIFVSHSKEALPYVIADYSYGDVFRSFRLTI